MFMDDLMDGLSSSDTRVIMYADDLAISASNRTTLQNAINTLNEWCQRNGMTINSTKTKVMKFSKGGGPSATDRNFFSCNQQPIELVNEFNYLGILLQPTLCFTKHVNKTMLECGAKIALLCRGAGGWSLLLASKAFNMFIMAKVRYGLRIVTPGLTLANMLKLDTIKHRFLRKVLTLPPTCRTEALYDLTGEKRLCEELIASGLTFRESEMERYRSHVLDDRKRFSITDIRNGPAYRTNSWKLAGSKTRHAIIGATVHGFHSMMCSKPNCFNRDGCLCKICERPADRHHILDCDALTDYSLTERFFKLESWK
jgi:hypothetical protein